MRTSGDDGGSNGVEEAIIMKSISIARVDCRLRRAENHCGNTAVTDLGGRGLSTGA
jgi:hypothetical protein